MQCFVEIGGAFEMREVIEPMVQNQLPADAKGK